MRDLRDSSQTDPAGPQELASNRLPLHVEISEGLAREIEAGILSEGYRLAPERTMAQELGVSVGTLRKALADLADKGMIERIQGSGNYVRRSDLRAAGKSRTIYGFFRLELLLGGGLPTAKVVSIERMDKPAELGFLTGGPQAFRFRRLRRLNGIDAAVEEMWIDAAEGVEISKAELSDSLYLFYRERFDFWITRAEDSVSVAPVAPWKPESFGSGAGDIWGFIERKSFDQHNRCVEFSRTWFDPATTRFVARWK